VHMYACVCAYVCVVRHTMLIYIYSVCACVCVCVCMRCAAQNVDM
jgi:hypothetical protein